MTRSAVLLLVLTTLFPSPSRSQVIDTYAGNGLCGNTGDGGPATLASFCAQDDIDLDAAGNLHIADANVGIIRRVDAATGLISTVAGNGVLGFSGDGGPATLASFNYPTGIAFDATGNMYVSDFDNCAVRKVDALTGTITTVIGGGPTSCGYGGDGGPGALAQLHHPIRITHHKGSLYIADYMNHRIRRWDIATDIITTVAGSGTMGFSGDGGPATAADLNAPEGITFDSSGNLYFTDTGNFVVRKVDALTGVITTFAGTPGVAGYTGDGGPATAATFSNEPDDIQEGCNGNIFVSDDFNNVIRMVNISTGTITTVAGNGTAGYSGDGGLPLAAQMSHPEALVLNAAGDLLVSDYDNSRIRIISLVCNPTPTPTRTATPSPTFTPSRTATPSATPTLSLTPTPTWTLTPTFTRTETLSPTPTLSLSPTLTSTSTLSPTRTQTPTVTPTPTPSSTPTPRGRYTLRAGVYNEAGELVRTLFVTDSRSLVLSLDLSTETLTSLSGPDRQVDLSSGGTYLGTWSGLNAIGDPVTNGVYHIKIDNIDDFGSVTTVTRQVHVDRRLAKVTVAVFNGAGEVVRRLRTLLEDASGAQLNDVILGDKVVQVGIGDAPPTPLQVTLSTTTGPVTLWWDGRNDAGAEVFPGHYQLETTWDDGQGGIKVVSTGLMVQGLGKPSGSTLTASPNRLSAANGFTTTLTFSPAQGRTLEARIYTLAGEVITTKTGPAGGDTLDWDTTGLASGLYLIVTRVLNPEGSLYEQHLLKVVIQR